MNSFDSQSAGHRLMRLREIMEKTKVKRTLHPLQTREALINYFIKHKKVII